jgi:large subunit ribosomal protein L13
MKHTIDATNRSMGRVASEAAKLLMGKQSTEYVRNKVFDIKLEITNASKLKIDEKKLAQKVYVTYESLYPGGDKRRTAKDIAARKGMREILKEAIYGMIPHNKLRAKIIKNLTINE